jgi:uncharacterized cupin superfamily protein
MADGWFVLNAEDARWLTRDGMGKRCRFEPKGDGRFPQLGIQIGIFGPGQPSTMYHAEDGQEGFLVLRGSCLAIVEEQEIPLRRWDYVHCPPGTRHSFVNEGDEDCVLLMVGARVGGGIVYPVSETALRHGAGVERETSSPDEAYARFGDWLPTDPAEL